MADAVRQIGRLGIIGVVDTFREVITSADNL